MTLGKALVLIAFVCFLLAALGVPLGPLSLLPLGLAFLAASKLV